MSSVSVVTNALRLRGFRRPQEAREILHPALRRRVADVGYLAGIGVAALVVGALLVAYTSRPGMDMGLSLHAATAVPDQVVPLSTTDNLRFSPDSFTFKAGQTVAFKISNPTGLAHEFVIGDEAVQQRHEQEMARGGMAAMADDSAYAVDLPPRQTVTLVYTFDKPGTLLFGCHVAGHYAAGMRGTITITQ